MLRASLSLLVAVTLALPACTFAFSPQTAMEGEVAVSGLTADREVASILPVTTLRGGLSATYYARASLYGELLTMPEVRLGGIPGADFGGFTLDAIEAGLFGAELALPVLLPVALAADGDFRMETLGRLIEVKGGIAGGSGASSRYVGVGASIDLVFGSIQLAGVHRWLEVDVAGEGFEGRAELAGWRFEVGMSLPGDLVRFLPFIRDIPL